MNLELKVVIPDKDWICEHPLCSGFISNRDGHSVVTLNITVCLGTE